MISNGLKYRKDQVISELKFETSRSSGKGGQHVNKTESRVTAVFDLNGTEIFSETEKTRIRTNLRARLQSGILRVSSQEDRSQHRNKEIAINRILEVLDKALYVPKPRKKKSISANQKAARLKSKKQQSERKELRKKISKGDF